MKARLSLASPGVQVCKCNSTWARLRSEFRPLYSRSIRCVLSQGGGFIPAHQMVERPVKEIPDQVVQLLNRVEFDRHQFVRCHAVAGKCHQSVLADELPQMLLGENQ